MSKDHAEHISDLLPGYVLGSLDPEELQELETHLDGCAACQQEAAELAETVGLLALAGPELEPPPALRGRLQRQVSRSSDEKSGVKTPAQVMPERQPSWLERWRLPYGRPAWVTGLVVLLVGLLVSNLLWWQTFSRVQAPPEPGEMMAVELTPAGDLPEAAGFILVSADGLSGAIVIDDVPILGEEQQYQLWLIRDGERESAAVLSVDDLGYGGSRVNAPRSLFEYDSLEITVEPAKGSPTPTGERVLTGTLFSP